MQNLTKTMHLSIDSEEVVEDAKIYNCSVNNGEHPIKFFLAERLDLKHEGTVLILGSEFDPNRLMSFKVVEGGKAIRRLTHDESKKLKRFFKSRVE